MAIPTAQAARCWRAWSTAVRAARDRLPRAAGRCRRRAHAGGGGGRAARRRPGRADPGRGRLVRRPQLGPAVPRHRGHARGARHRGRARGLSRLRPDQGRGRGAGQAAGRRVRPAPGRGDRARAAAPARRRGRRPGSRAAAGGVGRPAPGTRTDVPGRAGFQPDPRQPHRRGLWPGRHPDHPQGPLRPRPRHPRRRLRHRRPGGAQAGVAPIRCSASVPPWPRCCARPPRLATPPCPCRRAATAGRAAGRPAGNRRRRDRARAAGRPPGAPSSPASRSSCWPSSTGPSAPSPTCWRLARRAAALAPARCRGGPGAQRGGAAGGPGPGPARRHRARHPQPRPGDHRRPGHRQDHAGARHPGGRGRGWPARGAGGAHRPRGTAARKHRREARTLHRLLEADPERGFRRNRGRRSRRSW